MSFSSFANLKTAVADYLQRTDMTSAIVDCVTLCEAMMNNGDPERQLEPLRISAMETTAVGTLSSSAFALASDFLEMIRATYIGTVRTPLTYLSANDLDAVYPTTDSGDPVHYMVIGSTLTIRPTATGTVSYTYYQKIPALSDSNTTNWLLLKAPQAYLYGTLFQAAIYNRDADAASAMLSLYRGAMAGLERSDRGSKAGQFVMRVSSPAW